MSCYNHSEFFICGSVTQVIEPAGSVGCIAGHRRRYRSVLRGPRDATRCVPTLSSIE